ncbi:Diacylglycerol kinase catalytic domain containing protein, putative [Trypanosoma equiperdum]|uniref:Uncharacterized protein n=2 Tax=Trypanozoon TaxID=39700 RepID=Q387U7_TRYB2|nr:hypothetical protein, conserved [Trypanosoma brucei brucei TREU927]EAN78925.1 hypothetical protein, conserved [Trypanosoma brucei brucei TREU927]SCU72115.1 Diacylglycerol kinase catalytic domain containing protein, putative [Trypanosoma equiperdum]
MFSQLRVHLVVHKGSGGGKGGKMMRRVEKALRRNFSAITIRELTGSEALAEHMDPTGHAVGSGTEVMQDTNPTAGRDRTTDGVVANEGVEGELIPCLALCVDIITTEGALRVREVVEELACRVVSGILRNALGSGNGTNMAIDPVTNEVKSVWTKVFNVFAVIGGDGSLGEAVNGLCFGTLKAYRSGFCTALDTAACSRPDSMHYYRGMLEDRAILRHFLPPVMYVPAGTGSDFARTRLCCLNAEEFVTVLRDMHEYLAFTSDGEGSQRTIKYSTCLPIGSPSSASTSGSIDCSVGPDCASGGSTEACGKGPKSLSRRFAVYDVDVSRITFPRSGRTRFFINECSCGMSCDVISRCEKYKQSCTASFVAGPVLFAAASVASVMRMKPRSFRVFPLPDFPTPPPSMGHQHKVPVVGVLHPRHLSMGVAVSGMCEEMSWLQRCEEVGALSPSTEPLRVDANYYIYKYDREGGYPSTPDLSGGAVGAQSTDIGSEKETVINPFYTDWRCESASNTKELLSILDRNGVYDRWTCFSSSTLVFGNGRWFGGGLQVAPHANPTDGLLSVTNWVASPCQFVMGAPSLYNGNHKRWRSTTIWNTSRCIMDVDTISTQEPKFPDSSPPNPVGTDVKCNGEQVEGTEEILNGGGGAPDKIMMWCEADGELCEPIPAIVEVTTTVSMILPLRTVF